MMTRDRDDMPTLGDRLIQVYELLRSLAAGSRSPDGRVRARRQVAIGAAPLYVIGDVHGRLDLLLRLEAQIVSDAAAFDDPPFVVLVGDLVDRGPQSAQVLDHVMGRQQVDHRYVALTGNHEVMMAGFLARPERRHSWLNNGGDATLASYGLSPDMLETSNSLKALLTSRIPDEHLEFLDSLPIAFESETIFVSHAGIRPGVGLEAQRDTDLLWRRDDITIDYADARKIVVHGHQPVAAPALLGHRIGIDTAAFATGRLTAVRLVAGMAPKFLNTGQAGSAGAEAS